MHVSCSDHAEQSQKILLKLFGRVYYPENETGPREAQELAELLELSDIVLKADKEERKRILLLRQKAETKAKQNTDGKDRPIDEKEMSRKIKDIKKRNPDEMKQAYFTALAKKKAAEAESSLYKPAASSPLSLPPFLNPANYSTAVEHSPSPVKEDPLGFAGESASTDSPTFSPVSTIAQSWGTFQGLGEDPKTEELRNAIICNPGHQRPHS
jgi:hypothetical protein